MKTSPQPDLQEPLTAGDEDTRRALTLLWLAEATPLTAAPPDSLTNLRAAVLPAESAPAPRRPWRTVAAFSGWAAAACLAIWISQHPATPDSGPPSVAATPPPVARPVRPITKNPVSTNPVTEAGTVQPLTDPADLRRQLTELRAALVASGQEVPGTHRPVIRELRPPGSVTPAAGQDRVLDIIATALESDLNRRAPARDNAREVVIESGWANWTSALPADVTFRHRQFPAGRWGELGLLKSSGGQFLDPSTGWLWTPDPGSTDYTGRVAPPDLDRSLFSATAPPGEKPAPTLAAGYLITGSQGEAIVALNGLPSVPEGASLYITTFSASGEPLRYGVNNAALSGVDGWSFSGIIPADSGADFTRGLSLEMNHIRSTTVILSTLTGAGK